MTEQIEFKPEFVDNPEPRCPCVLLLDVSGSMQGQPIAELNAGLKTFQEELNKDDLAMKRVEVAIVTFGPTKVELPFTSAMAFHAPTLTAQGDTPMGAAITQALSLVDERKKEYRANGISYFRPWIFLVTDGGPTDAWDSAAAAIREGDTSRSFAFFAIGVQGARMDILQQIAVRAPLMLKGLSFRELFSWLSTSLRQKSRSTPSPESEIPLPPPGWTSA